MNATHFAAISWERLGKVPSGRKLIVDGDICIADVEGTATKPFEVSCTFIADCMLIFLNVCKSLMSLFSCGVSRNNQRLK